MTNQLTEKEYKQMASEILEASVSVWNDTLTDYEDGIKIDDLWPILDKYLKAKEDEISD